MARTPIFSVQFINIISGNDASYIKNDVTTGNIDTIVIDSVCIEDLLIIPRNIYTYPIKIKNSTAKYSFIISHAIFEKSLTFINCNLPNFIIDSGVFESDLWFEQLTISTDFKIKEGTFNGRLILNDAKHIKDLWIQGGSFNQINLSGKYSSIWIAEGIFKDKVNVARVNVFYISISGGQYDNDFILHNLEARKISVHGGVFKNLIFSQVTVLGNTTISKGTMKGFLKIAGGAYENIKMQFQDLRINCLLLCDNLKTKLLSLTSSDEFPENAINILILLDLTNAINDSIRLTNIRLNALYVSSFINYGNFLITNLLYDVRLKKDYDIELFKSQYPNYEPPKSNCLSVHNSDLGKLTFINCEIETMSLYLVNSKLVDVFLASRKFPNKLINTDPHQSQLAYAQLKKINENRGFFISAANYYAEEMNSYIQVLESMPNTLGERLSLYLNKISTNHGQRWDQGLLTTIVVGIIFYVPYCLTIGYEPALETTNISTHYFYKCFSHFFEFLNPLHKYDFFVSTEFIGSTAYLIDSLGRIFIAYFIYQLIQAFRKHGKSK